MTPASVPQAGGKYAIVAEDDRFMAEMMGALLQEQGVAVAIAVNGEEAIRLLTGRLPDLLLLDLLMPKADGYQVLDYIRQYGLVFPIVVISNLSLDEEKQRSLGVNDFIIKSNLDEDELWSRIEKHFRVEDDEVSTS